MPTAVLRSLGNEALEAARRYANRSRSDSTWRTYVSAWSCFEMYCQLLELTSLPVDGQTIALFIGSEADAGKAVSTLEHRLAAIRLVHLGKGYASPHNTQVV